MEYYESLDVSFITELWQLQKIFTGYKCGLADIAQLAFFSKDTNRGADTPRGK